MRSMSQVCLFLRSGSVKPLKSVLSPSRESGEAGLAYSPRFWYNSRSGNAAEHHYSERVPHRHERYSPDAGRVHWAARGAICNRYAYDNAYPGAANQRIL